MNKHTPGPWRRAESYRPEIQNVGTSAQAPYILCADGRNVAAAMIGGFEDMAEVDANARLIAAAPELLAAAEKCLPYHGPFQLPTTLIEELRVAIAKATGSD